MKTSTTIALVTLLASLFAAASSGQEAAPRPGETLRVGIIGLDTSHAIAFTKLLNAEDPKPEFAGCRVVAAYPQGSPDIASSVSRVPEYTEQIKKLGVEIVDSIDALLSQVDVVLLESNDGRVHLDQARPVLAARKRMFIDKPMAASLADVLAIFELARRHDTPIFTASGLRFAQATQSARNGAVGDVLGCDTHGPCHLEATHPDLFWYGIHGVEALFTVMGPDCTSVTRTSTPDADFVVGRWADGRIGTYRGMRVGKQQFGGTVYGTTADAPAGDFTGYEPLVAEIVKFFRGGSPPVTEEETVAIFAFMEGADASKRLGGQPVDLAPLLDKAKREARGRLED